jgi:hypothetical protein
MPLPLAIKKGLLFYWANPESPPTVNEQIRALKGLKGVEFDEFNLNYDSPGYRQPFQRLKALLQRGKLSKYDLIVFHNTASYNIDNLRKSFSLFSDSMTASNAKKILFKQDEMIQVNKTKDFIRDFSVDVLFTCISPEEISKIYPQKDFPKLRFRHVITGYLSEDLVFKKNKPLEERKIDISYRGMKTPPEWGALANEKYEIAQRFLHKASEATTNLVLDISCSPERRFSGTKWYDFLEDSRACLAVESGASVFDFDGSIKKAVDAVVREHPGAEFSQFTEILKPHENRIRYNQVSPRHLEAAALETGLIMYEGEYSGLFSPNINYIPLKKDFSNFETVLTQFQDTAFLKSLIAFNKKMVQERNDLHVSSFLKIVQEVFND